MALSSDALRPRCSKLATSQAMCPWPHPILPTVPSTHPDLQLHTLLLAVDCLHFEVDAHGADEGRGEGVVSVAEEEGGLTNAAVANDEQFEHVVKILVGGIFDSSFTLSY